jgi:hypothetical protein
VYLYSDVHCLKVLVTVDLTVPSEPSEPIYYKYIYISIGTEVQGIGRQVLVIICAFMVDIEVHSELRPLGPLGPLDRVDLSAE